MIQDFANDKMKQKKEENQFLKSSTNYYIKVSKIYDLYGKTSPILFSQVFV